MSDESSHHQERPRLPGLDADATPVVGFGLGLTGILLGLRPKLAPWPLVITVAAALLFRDPERATPLVDGALFAPADGMVVALDEIYEHRFLHTDAVRLTIAVSPLDVPVQRSPVTGRVLYVEDLAPGQPVGWVERHDETDRGAGLLIGLDAGWSRVLLAVSASPLLRRAQLRVAKGDQLLAGTRVTTARLGARVELLIPGEAVAGLPELGTRVVAGVTPVGQLVGR
jgi:phosphatidylserine decarboxylase